MRLLVAITNQDRRAAVYFNRELDEYSVRFTQTGLDLSGADYHTDNQADAYDTMNAFVNGWPDCLDIHMIAFGGSPTSKG
jgi:hypothetical protein